MLIHAKQIPHLQDLLPLLQTIAQSGRPLLVLAESVEAEALAALAIHKMRGPLHDH